MKGGGGRVGAKEVVTAERGVCAGQHPAVTETMRHVLASGGNAVDAGIAGSLVSATVQQEMSNHAGTVTCVLWEAATGQAHALDSRGTIVPGLAPFRPVPAGKGLFSTPEAVPIAVIPGFMPGLKAMFERFASKPWAELCEPAIRWAEEGHEVRSFEHFAIAQTADIYLYTPSGRAHFAPNGHLPQVGDRWPKPELAETLRVLADEGPDYFITGGWAKKFVERANELGWKITLEHMSAVPPRWGKGSRFVHRDHEIVQLASPQVIGSVSALFLGILDALDVSSHGHYTESAEALYYVGHALRRATAEVSALNDPVLFEDPTGTLLSPEFHALLADVIRRSKPRIDLTEHVETVAGKHALRAADPAPPTAGSCELSMVDADGNWLQMMNTLQTGGIPGEVIDGVPMVGSHARPTMASALAAWFTGGGRVRSTIGNTLVLKDGTPVWALGTPGVPYLTVPQVLLNRLHYGLDPYAAEDAPRVLPLTDDYKLPVESRVGGDIVSGLAALGVLVEPLPAYDYHMGSFQMSWRDEDGTLHASAGPRREGSAAGF